MRLVSGIGGIEQVELLVSLGVDPRRVALSHTDKVDDIGYHLGLVATGVNIEFDQALRHPIEEDNTTVRLTSGLIQAGHIAQVMLGTDGARRSMWSAYGGSPGLAALMTGVVEVLRRVVSDEAAIDQLFVANPARFFAFEEAV